MTILALFILFILLAASVAGAFFIGAMALIHSDEDTAQDDRNPVNPSH